MSKPNRFAKLLAIAYTCCIASNAGAQVLPLENDSLNYRIIGFSVPSGGNKTKYTLEVANGIYSEEQAFKKHVFLKQKTESDRVIATVPAFGRSYTWRMRSKKGSSPLYHFHVRNTEYADTSKYRMRIISDANKYPDMLVLPDHAPVMYNMKGELVWHIPDIPGVVGKGRGLRDLKPTDAGTFTVLNDLGAFEFDYNGKVVWQAPNDGQISGDSEEHYHHEFTRLPNRHYMVAGLEFKYIQVPEGIDTTGFATDNTISRRDGVLYKKVDSPTLIEYDGTGKIVWHWRAWDHLRKEEYFIVRFPDGSFNSNPHLNSFFFDKKQDAIYISLRNFNRVAKIDYATGKIIAEYGEYLNGQNQKVGATLFKAQHCVRVAANGNIYMFDNNTDRGIRQPRPSYVSMFAAPAPGENLSPPYWQFSCDIDSNTAPFALGGGSVYLLSDSSMLVGMGIAGRSFIVNRKKQLLWNALTEYKNEEGTWTFQSGYRISHIPNVTNLAPFIYK